ncbi:MAG: pyrimidine utilization protein D [Pseudoxanthomonas sp.]
MAAAAAPAHDLHGAAGAGPPLLFSSGLGGLAGYWDEQWPALLAAGHRAITYDQRGCGRSAGILAADYRIADMADDVLDLLDATGTPRCHFVGHALGGLVGLELARRAPARLASLVLVNAWARLSAHTARCFEARLALLDHAGPAAYLRAQPLFLYPADWSEAHGARIEAEVAHAIAHFPGVASLRARIGALQAFDATAALAQIATPTLVIAAGDDLLVPWTCSQALAAGLPQARLQVLAHGAHALNVVEPEPFNARLLAFLAAQDSGT